MGYAVQQTMTGTQWWTSNPVLAAGQVGYETDTGNAKLGDGASTWRQLRYTVQATPVPASLIVGGDSYLDPVGIATSARDAIGERLRLGLGIPAPVTANLAISGSMVRNHQTGCSYARVWQHLGLKRTVAPYTPDSAVTMVKWGTNDAIRGTATEQMNGYAAGMRSVIRRAQAGSVFQHGDASVSRGGTGWTELLWSALGSEPFLNTAHDTAHPWGGGTGCWRCATVSSWIQFTVPADHTGWVDIFLIGSVFGSTFSISVDGVTTQTGLRTGGLGLPVYAAPLYDERNGCVFGQALTLGTTHTVRLTITGADSGGGSQNPGELRFDSWAIRCGAGMDPLVLACETPAIPNPGAFWPDVTRTAVTAYNRRLRTLADEINGAAGRTWPVAVVPMQDIGTPQTFPDQAGHPNVAGAAAFAGAVIDGYTRASFPPGAVLWRPSWENTTAAAEHGSRFYRANVGPAGTTDNFTRANSTSVLGGSWTAVRGTWGINGNAAYITAGSGLFDAQIATLQTAMPNGRISVAMNAASLDNYGLAFRVVDANNLITLVQSSSFGAWVLRVIEANAITRSVTITGVPTAGQTVTVDFDGDQVWIYFAGVLTASGVQTVTQHRTATQHGLTAPWVTAPDALRFDDFYYGAPGSVRDGDIWFDSTANNLYGPAAAGAWGTAVTTT